jgi:L-ascorbate metabolism protein UlaG (beta-lactamase superfamily)
VPEAAESVRIHYLGHATVLAELDGVRVLTDPVLRRRVAHLRRKAPPVVGELGSLDAVLVSHAHYDHLDFPSLARLDHATTVVVPRGLGQTLSKRGFERVVELDEDEEVAVGALTVRATHADHSGSRPPLVRHASALGYVLSGSRSIFFAGDTDLFPEMDGLVADLDVALIPVWGWGGSLGPGHMNPQRAADALALLRPRIAIPIHWGTFVPLHRSKRARFLRLPVEEFVRAARNKAPDVDVHVLNPGEEFGE